MLSLDYVCSFGFLGLGLGRRVAGCALASSMADLEKNRATPRRFVSWTRPTMHLAAQMVAQLFLGARGRRAISRKLMRNHKDVFAKQCWSRNIKEFICRDFFLGSQFVTHFWVDQAHVFNPWTYYIYQQD
jgi:hypothetical protein